MANTYELIASSTVGAGGAATITFSSIPNTYTDLLIKTSIRTARASYVDDLIIRPNGSSANGSTKRLYGTGSAAGSDSHTDIRGMIDGNNATSSTFGNAEIYIPNYTSSNYKSFSIDSVIEDNATNNFDALCASLWSNTSVISSIDLVTGSGSNFNQYSTAYLYGIKNS